MKALEYNLNMALVEALYSLGTIQFREGICSFDISRPSAQSACDRAHAPCSGFPPAVRPAVLGVPPAHHAHARPGRDSQGRGARPQLPRGLLPVSRKIFDKNICVDLLSRLCRCVDCSVLLSSEEEGRGCYPLDNDVLCKGCNTRRIQHLTQALKLS